MVEANDEFFREHVLIAHKQLHKGSRKFSLLSVALLEIEYNRLQEMLNADFPILLDQGNESFLKVLPSLHYVVLLAGVEARAEKDPVAEFRSEPLGS